MKRFYFGLALIVAAQILSADAAAQNRQEGRAVRRQSGGAAKVARASAGKTEPVRALGGQMVGNKIIARLSNDRPGFDYIVTGAQIVDGKLQLQGTVKPVGKAAPANMRATATLVGTMSKAATAWPRAGDNPPPRPAAQTSGQPAQQQQGREARNPETAGQLGQLSQSTQPTARTTTTPSATEGGQSRQGGEVTEQTQSLYTAVEIGSGCEIIYFKMELPPQLTATARASQPVQLGVVLAPMDNQAGEKINQQMCRVVRSLKAGQTGQTVQADVAQLNSLLAGSR